MHDRMDEHAPDRPARPLLRPLLRPGLKVVRRDDRHLQAGLDPGTRVVLPDDPDVRVLIDDLSAGRAPTSPSPAADRLYAALRDRGLVVDADRLAAQARVRSAARIAVDADPRWRPVVVRALAAAGLATATRRDHPTAAVVVSATGEPPRSRLDQLVRSSQPHLLVTQVSGRVTVGPFVSPGLTACQRCVDAHATDRDPRYPVILEQHLSTDPGSPAGADLAHGEPALVHLAVTWAAQELVTFVDGAEPATWSTTITIDPGLTLPRQRWRRHPHCGCSWGDGLVAG